MYMPWKSLYMETLCNMVYRLLKMEKMKITFNVTVAFLICLAVAGCKKYDDDYKAYLNNKETVYPGLVKNIGYKAGHLRTALFWNPSPIPVL